MATLPDLQAELAALRAENAALKASRGKVTFKTTAKGGFSVYGLGQFPFTFYLGQWRSFEAAIPELQAFVKANMDNLVEKTDDEVTIARKTAKARARDAAAAKAKEAKAA